ATISKSRGSFKVPLNVNDPSLTIDSAIGRSDWCVAPGISSTTVPSGSPLIVAVSVNEEGLEVQDIIAVSSRRQMAVENEALFIVCKFDYFFETAK
ncbi:MAG: hypothetical protein WCS56_05460, partial [Bacilli bacterium]